MGDTLYQRVVVALTETLDRAEYWRPDEFDDAEHAANCQAILDRAHEILDQVEAQQTAITHEALITAGYAWRVAEVLDRWFIYTKAVAGQVGEIRIDMFPSGEVAVWVSNLKVPGVVAMADIADLERLFMAQGVTCAA